VFRDAPDAFRDVIVRPATVQGSRLVVETTVEASRTGLDPSRAFWRYWSGSTASGLGDAVTTVALPLVAVVTLRASAVGVGFVTGAADLAWMLIGLPAGVLVGRMPLRGGLVAMDLIRAVAIGSVPVVAAVHVLSLGYLVAVALVIGLASVVFSVGNSTFLPSIVPAEELTSRNSLMSGSDAATTLCGPALGGLLVQLLGPAVSLLVDTASYVCSASLLGALPRAEAHAGSKPKGSMWSQIKEGLAYVVRHRVIASCTVAAMLICLVSGALTTLTPLFLVRTLGLPVGLVGVVLAAEGVGGLIGAALTPKLERKLGGARALVLTTAVGGASSVLLPLATRGAGVLLYAMGLIGYVVGVVVLSVLTRTYRQLATPRELYPRVKATVRFLTWGVTPIGAVGAGVLATSLGIRAALWTACVLAVAVPLVLWISPVGRMRELAARVPAEQAP
jgi:MFS family permease